MIAQFYRPQIASDRIINEKSYNLQLFYIYRINGLSNRIICPTNCAQFAFFHRTLSEGLVLIICNHIHNPQGNKKAEGGLQLLLGSKMMAALSEHVLQTVGGSVAYTKHQPFWGSMIPDPHRGQCLMGIATPTAVPTTMQLLSLCCFAKTRHFQPFYRICYFSSNGSFFMRFFAQHKSTIVQLSIHTNQAIIRLVFPIFLAFQNLPKKSAIFDKFPLVPSLLFCENSPFSTLLQNLLFLF